MTMLTVISPACSEVQSTRSRPSAIHLPGWLNMSQQRQIAEAFHEWSTGPLPIRATSLPGGHQMSVRTLRLGRHQQPSTRNTSVPDGQRVTEFPGWLAYELPRDLMGIALKGKYAGQKLRWFAMRFDGSDDEIDIVAKGAMKAEFDDWRWASLDEVASLAVPPR